MEYLYREATNNKCYDPHKIPCIMFWKCIQKSGKDPKQAEWQEEVSLSLRHSTVSYRHLEAATMKGQKCIWTLTFPMQWKHRGLKRISKRTM